MFLLLLYFVLNVYSDTAWCEFGVVDGLITDEHNDGTGNRNGWDHQKGNTIDYFVFGDSGCCTLKDMTLLFYNNDTWTKCVNFTSDNSDSGLTSITMINTYYLMQHVIDTQNMKNGITFYFGCFGTDYYLYHRHDESSSSNYYCRSSVDDTAKTNVKIYSSDLILYGDVDQKFELHFEELLSIQPYIFITGISQQSVFINFDVDMMDDYLSNDIYYLFTTNNINTLSTETLTNGYIVYNICNRESIQRYGIIKNSTTQTDCSCWVQSNDTSITNDSIFNYPDCYYNSSMFDLKIPDTVNTYKLSDDFLEWYSIIFTTSNQSIEINDEKTLIIDELNINQNEISFNGNVNVKNLIITSVCASFDILNFDDITISDDNYYKVLFTLQSTTTDLESLGLIQDGNDVYLMLCFYNGINYVNVLDSTDNNCSTLKLKDNIWNLIIQSSEYSVNEDEYWNELNISESSITLNGTSTLTSNVCEFEDKTITINCNLNCTTMNINSNTKLIVNGELSIDKLVITDEISNNLNENGIIESYGSTSITSIEITTQSNCIELISSNSTITKPSINSNYSTLLLSQNHLLRICPSSNINYGVECTTIGNTFEQQSFETIHCPCIDELCIINVNTTQIDSRNIEFNGTFNILSNSTILISDQAAFTIITNDIYNQLILIGDNSIGFYQSNTKSTILKVQASSVYPCKALLIENDQYGCIDCNATYNYNGYCTDSLGDIDNCKIFNENYGCSECKEGYESKLLYCNECPLNCLRCYDYECINCEMNYQLNETNQCELINNPIISFDNNKTMKCNDSYYSNTNQCIECKDDNCITCNSSECLTCNTNYTLNNGYCQTIESNNGEEIISNYGVIDCNNGYYSNNSQCINCSLTFDNCELCNINGCLSCSNGVIINNGSCSLNTNCLNINDSICLSCDDKGSWFNGNECLECGNNCKNCINGYCIECNDGYILQSDNNCTQNSIPDNCITLSNYGTCQRCSDGYYLNNDLCYECNSTCITCHNSTYCFECNDGYMLNSNNECVDMSELNANCKTAIPGNSGGCAICNDGYYRDQTYCKSCITNCTKCNNGESCLICESNYFLLNDASECISYDDLTNCETKTQSGCTKCNDSYYLNNQYCISCSDTTENCNTCNNNGECLTCQNDYILINYECINYQLIDSCTEVSDSKCKSCSFWHTPNSDQTGCDTQVVWWVIVLIILVILIIFIIICVLIWYVTKTYLNYRKIEKQRKLYTIFDMSRSNIQFKTTNNKDVVINKEVLLFDDDEQEIDVDSETRDLICVGNSSKQTIKVQFSVKDGCDKYEIRTNPQLMTIPKGKALEFEIFIKPLCTCKINDQIMLISANLTKGKTITIPINVSTQTSMTSHLDYDELEEDIKLGEGSFGIVYKGTFRGNQVAIKKMKNVNNNEKAIEEFNKEVSMLDKFRSEYIIHFYGAVMIPNKMCMVTELAEYGSVQDLMKKNSEISKEKKMKFLIDAAKGIQYLHSNVILHRDIKPDNILVISLDPNALVNAKLTDFGSSRNVNSLMSNMTFTKGIGTPKYMAPEILAKQKYQLSSDVYSFAVTMFEIYTWKEIYPNTDNRFKFPWGIADFITKGERLEKPEKMEQEIYDIIDKSWKHDINERIDINETIKLLESL